jgi:hypothetical protein
VAKSLNLDSYEELHAIVKDAENFITTHDFPLDAIPPPNMPVREYREAIARGEI